MQIGVGEKPLKFGLPVLAIAAGLMLAACGAESAPEKTSARVIERPAGTQDLDNAFANPPGEGIAVVNGSEAATIDVAMPANLNDFSEKLAAELDGRANSGTEAFAAAAQADQIAAQSSGLEFLPHSLDIKWVQTGPLEGNLTAFLGTYMTYTGGAHPNVSFDVLNWDMEKDQAVGFEDLFDDAPKAREHMTGLLRDGLVKAKRERLNDANSSDDDILSTWVDPAFQGNVTVFERFSLARSSQPDKAGGLIYHFAPYEVGSYAEGVYVIGVDYSDFSDYLSEGYINSFGGDAIIP